jgi:hypothetical protein
LSAQKAELLVHPGKKGSEKTVSYHRSLQDFSKALFKAGFAVTRLEEWISHKQSQKGPRQQAEDVLPQRNSTVPHDRSAYTIKVYGEET